MSTEEVCGSEYPMGGVKCGLPKGHKGEHQAREDLLETEITLLNSAMMSLNRTLAAHQSLVAQKNEQIANLASAWHEERMQWKQEKQRLEETVATAHRQRSEVLQTHKDAAKLLAEVEILRTRLSHVTVDGELAASKLKIIERVLESDIFANEILERMDDE